jgi:primosomal protein N' (replication factor Y)
MIVGVHPLAGFDKVLHYLVPEPMRADVQVGALVRVPVGRTLRLGIVGEIGAPKDFPIDKLKALAQVLHPFPALPPDLLGLARWMTVYYAAPLDGIIETMIPVAVRNGAGLKQEKQLALGQRLAAEELARGELIELGAGRCRGVERVLHHLCYRAAQRGLPKVAAFRAWLLEATGAEG